MATIGNLRERELNFLQNNLCDFTEENGVALGYCLENNYDQIIENITSINGTCFVKSEVHSREKGHRRYKSGVCFLITHSIITSKSNPVIPCLGNCEVKSLLILTDVKNISNFLLFTKSSVKMLLYPV